MKRRRNRRAEKRERRAERMAGAPRPEKGEFEVWVTKRGACYHPLWCSAVNGLWLSGGNCLQTLDLKAAEAAMYRMCELCDRGDSIPG